MKKLSLATAALVVFSFAGVQAQQKTKAGKVIDKVEHPVSKTATATAAKVTDKSLKNVKGPHGETVYVDKYQHKYYIDKKGKRIFIK